MMGLPTGWKPQLQQNASGAGLGALAAQSPRAPLPTSGTPLTNPRPTPGPTADQIAIHNAGRNVDDKMSSFGFTTSTPMTPTQNKYDQTNANGIRPYTDIYNPNAYQYGGQEGLAEKEAARYGGLASVARGQQADAAQQYQGALGQFNQGIDMSDQARQQQMQGLGYLQNMAQGSGPSAAQAQMAQGLSQAREQQASIVANARGGGSNLAAAQAAGANAASNLGLQGIQATGALRAQEQANAMTQYGQQAGALRTSDFGRAQLSGQQQQMAAGQQQFGAAQASQYEQYMQQVRAQQQGSQQAQEQQDLAREAAERGWSLSQDQINNAQTNSWLGAGTSLASAGLMAAAVFSDERVKEGVSDAGSDLDDTFEKLKPVNYTYKAGFGQEDGPQTGIMAQHLASSKAGASIVFKGDDGILRVKAPQAATLALAGLARLNERLRKLETGHARK